MMTAGATGNRAGLVVGLVAALAAALSGCSREGELDASSGIGVFASLDGCPVAAVPDGTGDVTLFDPEGRHTADAIDVVANITNVDSRCSTGSDRIYSQVDFDVTASRVNTDGARQVVLPYYSSVVQAGENVRAKRLGQVTLDFADGERVASVRATAGAYVDSALTRLSADAREAGQAEAAIDPMSDPEVREEVRRTSFEHLVGFQLTEDQLAYNVTR